MDAHERKVRKVSDAIRAKNWKVSFFVIYLLAEFVDFRERSKWLKLRCINSTIVQCYEA